jgi:regulator of replication initiation timing
MAFVQRANVILEVADDDIQYYYQKGYNQIDEKTGKVILEAIPTDISVLRAKYMEHLKEIKELQAENEDLKKQLKKQTTKSKAD